MEKWKKYLVAIAIISISFVLYSMIPKKEVLTYQKYFNVMPGDTVVDIGACVGDFTFPALEKVGENGVVVAIEPDPDNFSVLQKRTSEYNNIVLVNKGVWNEKTVLDLNISSDCKECHSLIYHFDNETISIDVDTLDNILSEIGIQKIDFLKMDIEGAEIEAIEGASESLNITSKGSIASYHLRNNEKTAENIEEKLRNKGFKTLYDGNTYFWR